jgi:DNA transformation protein
MSGSTSSDYVDHIVDQLAQIGGIASGRFFGGVGLSCRGRQFAMMMGNTLYFAVDDSTRPRYVRQGSRCFSYDTKKGRVEVKKYYEVPADVLEDRDALVALARESISLAGKSYRQRKT